MKFINTKKPREYAQRLAAVKAEIQALRQQIMALAEEEKDLEQFLHSKSAGEDFQFNGEEGYLMTMKFIDRSRRVMDQPKVRAMFEKMGLKVPTRKSEWVETSIDYAEEE
jgi:phage host-nuclease inhibitor protein Gam